MGDVVPTTEALDQAAAAILELLVPLTLVPVEVFGGCDHPGCDAQCGTFGYGLCDAVGPGYSDCNRAEGKIFRIDDLPSDPANDFTHYEGEQVRVQILVREHDLPYFQRRFGDNPREGRPARTCEHYGRGEPTADRTRAERIHEYLSTHGVGHATGWDADEVLRIADDR